MSDNFKLPTIDSLVRKSSVKSEPPNPATNRPCCRTTGKGRWPARPVVHVRKSDVGVEQRRKPQNRRQRDQSSVGIRCLCDKTENHRRPFPVVQRFGRGRHRSGTRGRRRFHHGTRAFCDAPSFVSKSAYRYLTGPKSISSKRALRPNRSG